MLKKEVSRLFGILVYPLATDILNQGFSRYDNVPDQRNGLNQGR